MTARAGLNLDGASVSRNHHPMKTVSATELRLRFEELALEVENGESILVTRYGKPWLKVVPHQKRADDGGLTPRFPK